MFIKFANDAISEFAEGNFYAKNDGKPFEVDSALLAHELLGKKAWVGGELVDVFEPAVTDDGSGEMTESSLGKLKKQDLLNLAGELGVESVTEDNNKSEIVAKILEFKKEN